MLVEYDQVKEDFAKKDAEIERLKEELGRMKLDLEHNSEQYSSYYKRYSELSETLFLISCKHIPLKYATGAAKFKNNIIPEM